MAFCFTGIVAAANYGGGSGTAEDPYQIGTAADLIALGETPEDYDKHFVLTADIDFDPNLPGQKVFKRAVIAPDADLVEVGYQGAAFTGVFDGRGHTISRLIVYGGSHLGLFGVLGSSASVSNLGLEAVEIFGNAPAGAVGGLAGSSSATIRNSHCSGSIRGDGNEYECPYVGGLVGDNLGSISTSYSTGSVDGRFYVGGLVGINRDNACTIVLSCSSSAVSGTSYVGGLVGYNDNRIVASYSTGSVSGTEYVGGLIGGNSGAITESYSTGAVSGTKYVGGLAGSISFGFVDSSFWDTDTSGQAISAGGTGKTTAEMWEVRTFTAARWDFVGQQDGPHDIWIVPAGGGCPILWWQQSPLPELPSFSGGAGEPNEPYLISTAEQLKSIGHNPRLMTCHFRLLKNLDVMGLRFHPIGDPNFPYAGTFDGDGHTISHLTVAGDSFLGLFGQLGFGGVIRDLGVLEVNVTGSGYYIGGLVGANGGRITPPGVVINCCITGLIRGGIAVGGLVGWNARGDIVGSYSSASVSGTGYDIGGLVGNNSGRIATSYSVGSASGPHFIWSGLVGGGDGSITASFWDVEISGVDSRGSDKGKTTAQMQTASTFLDAGWDFVGETDNGTEDIWWIDEGRDYPRLWWEIEKRDDGTAASDD
jgi:hypothetical protein